MGVMGARRLLLGVLVSMCALACVLVGGAGSAWAAGGSFLFGPIGEEAGQISLLGSRGMAVDRESGDIYVGDIENNRIDKFDQSGKFLLAWGWGVIPGAEGSQSEGSQSANELQTCTGVTECGEGHYGSGAGEFDSDNVLGVAVDNEAGPSRGDVYAVNDGNYRVQEFDSDGKFLRMFGGHVNKNGTDVCVAGEECQAGTQGEGDGEFNWAYEKAYIAVGLGGDVYVGDKARVQIFEPSGTWKENISLSALSSEGKVTALAVNLFGDVFVKDEGVPGVRGFEPGGIEMVTRFDEEAGEAVESLALNAAGDLFIAEGSPSFSEPCVCDFKEYSPTGEELARFGGDVVSHLSSMVLDEALGELLVYSEGGVWGFPLPSPGPLVEPGSGAVTPELRGAATLEALVNSEGEATEAKFEYVDEADYKTSGYTSAVVTTPESIGSSFEDQHVVVNLPQKALVPGVTYHWRVVARNARGTSTGFDQSFEEIPPAYIEGPSAASVTATSVTLSGKVDPLGASTSYRLEYGASTSYGHTLAGNVGAGMSYVTLGYHVQELEAYTTYHYRLVTESEVGTVVGTDRTFTTQLAGGSLALPDGRAWELVSPPDKGGALIENVEHAQAASDGNGIVYAASEPIGEGIVGHVGNNADATAGATVLSERGVDGWRTRDISPKQTLPPEGESAVALFGAAEAFLPFTSDLSRGVLEPRYDLGNTPQSEGVTEPTLYLRNDTGETYEPLVTAANTPPGTKWSNDGYQGGWVQMSFLAATPNLTHILFSDWAALTPEARTEKATDEEYSQNLYDWSAGQLQLVNIIPNKKTMREESQPGASFGSNAYESQTYANPWAMSEDGRWIVFHYNQLGGRPSWYVRDMVDHRAVPFGNAHRSTKFETMSRDGSKLFYLEPENGTEQEEEQGELYVLDPATGTTMDLTADHLGNEKNADVQNMLVGISEDGSYVYFVAKGVLANGATGGQDNLYLMHDNGSEWKTTFVATLSGEDEQDWHNRSGVGDTGSEIKRITSRVTPNGRYVTFMSDRSLTGYDNTDALSGQPDEEVYLYNAETNRLVCASCNQNGARPVGVFDARPGEVLMDQSGAWAPMSGGESGHWLAASIAPNWYSNWGVATHRPPYLSDEGRLFFNSSDALVPQDTNGLADVYEYEPPGVGDCRTTSVTFSERSGGCVSLISSGQSAAESTFLDASESGDDVFFITAAKLVSEDYDTVNDVYDAHVCSTALPCRIAPVSSPACSSGDSCKAAPSPQPEIFGAAPSATFNGTGNVVEESKKGVIKPKAKAKSKKRAKGKRNRTKSKPKKTKGKKARKSSTVRTSKRGER